MPIQLRRVVGLSCTAANISSRAGYTEGPSHVTIAQVFQVSAERARPSERARLFVDMSLGAERPPSLGRKSRGRKSPTRANPHAHPARRGAGPERFPRRQSPPSATGAKYVSRNGKAKEGGPQFVHLVPRNAEWHTCHRAEPNVFKFWTCSPCNQ